jgi:hypothetical protein
MKNLGGAVKFTQYRDYAHRNHRKTDPGAEREGAILAPAPAGYWIQPLQRRPGDPKVAFLGHRSPVEPSGFFVLDSEQ